MKNYSYKLIQIISILLLIVITWGCSSPESYDVIIKNGQIIDGSGNVSFKGDISIQKAWYMFS